MKVVPIIRYANVRRSKDAAYARAELDRLIHDLGDPAGLYDRVQTLVRELNADGSELAAKSVAKALPLLREAELLLEHAKGRVGA